MSLCINPACTQPHQSGPQEYRFCQNCGSQLDLLERYRVMRLICDNSGFSKVYEAYEKDTPKIIKVLQANLGADPKIVELFQQEVAVLGQLNHPGIPKVDGYFQYKTRDGLLLHCLVMEQINGINLEQWLKQHDNVPISQTQAIAWLKQLLEILVVLHGKQYLHRDIKPCNIMIRNSPENQTQEDGGDLFLIDFGTAKELAKSLTGVNAIMSSGYSAPEQLHGEAVPQSDFFALGRTFVFLLTGYHPLDMYDIQHNVLHWRNRANHISTLLLNLIDWLMSPEIEKRPANAQEILQRLEEIEKQINANSTVNLGHNVQIEQPYSPTSKTLLAKPRPHLLALIAALIASLGLLWVLALILGNLKLNFIPNYGQAPERKGKVDYFPYEEGRDSKGRAAEFNIAVLSVEYKWLLGSNFQIKYNDSIISLEVLKLNLEQEGIQRIMENPTEIISVGTASCEGDVATEQSRALERSKQIQLLAKKLFSGTVKNYRLLNLGQFQRSDCQVNQDLTAYQRSIIIIGVKQKSDGVILDEALRNRLEKKPFADFKLEDYSLGSPQKFKTIPNNL
ncbi:MULTISPECIES: serine/threonine-protein kinase [unclassified Tolypothrix]|uniref:serine/threonine-protein kinase n=1 Tax=unclassified Tolypothrix TaxID=2649714 RepID=UPI0005F89684|nr:MULTISPECIES: serine/threonine-protein kinase [unclassified Tolypothrix]MBE9085359.1 serine/threonine protein kinase [Tolypothrix sp. LEGE 11397]UYD29355.1 serine/threonine protein kinase [Tolypothrix sp. PCC 7712]UYD34738.1 serine/threonine protein kinase [Tolypothrix sp. PCC 7601]BAY88686.1 serine/threonine protein kinase [Microchaete diplosiphon NIES-3275]